MAASKAALRYAKAILDLSIEMKSLDTIQADMHMLNDLCYSNRDFVAFLHSPIIQKRKKYVALDALFQGKVDKLTLDFLKLLTKNSRDNILPQVIEGFIMLYRKHMGILDVYVKSVIKLDAGVKKTILEKVGEHFDGNIELHESIDEKLIGGFVVTVNDHQIDASIKSQLANLKNILLN